MVVIAHGLWPGGAQESTLDMLGLLKTHDIDATVVTSVAADRSFVSALRDLGMKPVSTPHHLRNGYPDLDVERFSDMVKSADIVWITDIEYLTAERLKRIRKNIPIVAHLHSFALICPIWTKLFGMRELCTIKCSPRRITRCKQLGNLYLGNWHKINRYRALTHALLDHVKSPVDLATWPFKMTPLDNIDAFVTVSRFAKNLYLSEMPQMTNVPFEVVHNPILMPEPIIESDNSENTRLLYAGGASVIKGPHIVLHAVKQLQRHFESLKVKMLGVSGDKWIESIVRQLGIERNVELMPRVSRNEMYAIMADSRLILVPSITPETFGRIPVEANRSGTPSIVSALGALPESIEDGVTGFVSEPSVELLRDAIFKGLNTKWDRRDIAHRSRTRFDPKRNCDDFVKLLERLQ